MTRGEATLAIIGEIYDAAIEPQRWPQALDKVAAFVGGSSTLLVASGAEPGDWLALAACADNLDEGQRERMQALLPHLVRATEVMHRMREAKARHTGGLAALDGLGCGAIVLDERGAAAFVNQAARRICAENDGLKLRSSGARDAGGRLVAADAQVQRALEAAIADCLRPDVQERDCSRGLRVPRPSGRPDYVLQISSLSTRTDLRAAGTPGAVIVFLSDPDSDLAVDEAMLRHTYGLTPAESRLAQLLLNGATIGDAAKRLHVSEATAKTQLQHVFQKTQTHRQAELVRLLLMLGSGSTK